MRNKNVEDAYPLSPMQEGMLFHTLYAPGSGLYINQHVCKLMNLDPERLREAWEEVTRRHSVLRTAFVWKNLDKPLQIVGRSVSLPWVTLDWRHFDDDERRQRLATWLADDRARGFELTKAPLQRFALLRLTDETYQFVWSFHHLLLDGWSVPLVLEEVMAHYAAAESGRRLQLPAARPYRDYIAWLQRQQAGGAEAYWRARLTGFTTPTPLGIKGEVRGGVREGAEYGKRQRGVSAEVSEGLVREARERGVTLSTVVSGGWGLLLSRYSGERDVVFGTVVSGRPAELGGVERMVGMFINTLPQRVEVDGEMGVWEWLRRLQEEGAAAREYEYSPLVEVQGWSEVPRGLPLFESALSFQNYLDPESLPGGNTDNGNGNVKSSLAQVGEERFIERPNFPLNVRAALVPELALNIIYDKSIFDDATIARLQGHFCAIMESIVANPEQRLSEINLLGREERQQLLVEWNATQTEFPSDKCVHQLFEAQAESTPDAVAVVYKDEQLSYRELNERANQLAHHLRELGVGAETLVGLCVERSIEMVVGLLGILKAGGAYLPLDPSYPLERLSFMLADSAVSVLLTQEHLLDSLPAQHTHVLTLDADWPLLSAYSTENPALLTDPDNLCYVIYTSGSTGQPKGTLLPHRGVCNLSTAQVHAFGLTPADTILQFASLSFDASVFEIVMALGTGATLCLSPSQPVFDGAAFLHLLREQGVTVATLPPSVLSVLEPEGLARLRAVIAAGEACPREVVARWAVGRSFYNAYGPTEATVWATNAECAAEGGKPPIGRPIDNVEVYVVDREMRVVPVGVAGELLIGGAGLARGYLNRAELTAERFVPHPYTERGGARLYRTGDEVRYLPDGQIEYLGRIDQQVKLRGFRIEPGEIEAVLMQLPAVRESLVLVREDRPGEQHLVAYLTLKPGQELSNTEARGYLKERLPEYMLPTAIIVLDSMPLTPNGKVDRKALPSLNQSGAHGSESHVEARTQTQDIVANIWSKVLGVERVGIHDNFFELGGHSLLAMLVNSHIREAFQVDLTLHNIFDVATVAGLAEKIEELKGGGRDFHALPLVKVSRQEHLPPSFAQERLWFIDQLEPNSAAYNLSTAVRLVGDLHVTALQRSLEEIIRRHESLRTTFAMVEGRPVQVISPETRLSLSITDLSHLPEEERRAAARRLADEEAQQPFDLSTGPLVRAGLLKLTEERHVLLLTMHHTVSDGWSIGIFERELTSLYEAYRNGKESQLEELPIQYADYAVWQREWLQGEVLEEQLGYWREQLAGAPAVLELPTDRPRPPVQSHRGAVFSFALSESVSTGLRQLSRQEDVTLFMTLLAAWQTLLYRYSGQEDIVVGSSIAGRNRAEVEALIGFFVNMLVLRARLAPHLEFRHLLKQMREVCLGAYAHQDVPFEKLVEELQPERSQSHNPLFQVVFVLQNNPEQELELAGLRTGGAGVEGRTSQFDLTLSVGEGERGRLVAALEYNTDLYDAATIERMSRHLQTLVESIVANPRQKLSEIALLDAEERQQLLVEWNATQSEFPTDKCVHQLFEAQAESTPDAIAVVYKDEQLTYRELNERANQLAHHLRELGVGAETLVGLCVERSVEMVVGLLGILKAGGAYLPLDPSYPLERLSFMLADSAVSVLLTQEHLLDSLPAQHTHVLTLDADWPLLSAYSTENPALLTDADNLCYIIYTSGSTGQPKGVAVTHRNVVRLVRGTSYATFAADEVFLQLAPVSFDASTFEIWGALLNGARLAVMSAGLPSLLEVAEFIERREVTTLWLTAGLFQQMVEHQGGSLRGVRQVLAGGDVLPVAAVNHLLARMDAGGSVINGYGPTEATTFTCTHRMVAGEQEAEERSIPIGRPIANAEVYVVDGEMRIVPVGVAGELLIGGAGLARGYVNGAELTAERFVPHPYAKEAGVRLYRTGDQVRYLRDGRIEFLGRRDEQVKVRGFRIELGEIEAALGSHGSVRECVVVARAEEEGEEKRLVAYIVPAEAGEAGETLNVSELREYLTERLPEYMMPSVFVALEELPLTANGKVDKRALPAPDSNRLEAGDEYVAPRTPVEEVLCGIWAQVLRLERISVEDNFFELGGHSLIATQVISRVRESLQVELPLRSLFEKPTVVGLAESIEAERRAGHELQTPPLVRVSRQGHLPLSFAQERLWFIDQLEPGSHAYNIPTVIHLKGTLDFTALRRSLGEIIRRHESLRTTFSIVEGQPVQVISPELRLSFEITDLGYLPEAERRAEVRRLAAAEAQLPFDLSTGPLVRAGLLKLTEERHVLLLTMHHIVSDGWSAGVFEGELTSLYEGYTRGEESQLPELAIQYADYAVWQREWLQGEVLEEQLSYWREQLAGAPAVLELPTDRPRPPVQGYRGALRSFVLSEELSRKLKALSQREDVTLFMTLLAAWQTLLYRYSGQEDIVVGSPIAGRNRAELEELIGFFVNTMVLRTQLSGEASFRELLKQVREVCLGAYAHQEMPFEKLVEELRPERSQSHNPLFQVAFVLQNAPGETLDLAGLQLGSMESDIEAAKFDLMLVMEEHGDQIHASLQYKTELFDASSMARMLEHFAILLEGIVAAPEQRLYELPLLRGDERQRLLLDWNSTEASFPLDSCIHQLFEQQARRTPDAVALIHGEQRLSYGDLNERANQLAHYLRELGVGPETLVGICVERSIEMVVGLLGILKAGGAYLPLDPSYPQERLRFMLEDAAVPVVLTQQAHLPLLSEATANVVLLGSEGTLWEGRSTENPASGVRPQNLAYVIYTSGSTGTPKGVLGHHRGFINRFHWMWRTYPFLNGEVCCQKTSLNFLDSMWEIFGPLSQGVRLVLIDDEAVKDAGRLLRVLRRERVTRVVVVPSLLRLMLESGSEALRGLSLRYCVTSGEALPSELARQFVRALPECRLLNLYGSSEVAADVMYDEVYSGDLVTIGRPIANTRVYVLDELLRVVPEGVPGGVYVCGEGVARGYLGRAEWTAERFVPHPYSETGGERLYWTGDVGRWLSDGRIEYVGRADAQVKVRGFRIELGEVETALRQHAQVRECVVVAQAAENSETSLVAYVVAEEGASPTTSELHHYLKEKLPEYMVPRFFIMLGALPLTPSGKLDRRALPSPDQSRPALEDAYIAPGTLVEEVLCDLWSQVLKVERVGVRDNFFELGGHSLLATQLVSRMREAFRIDIPLRTIFEKKNIADLSVFLEERLLERVEEISEEEAEQLLKGDSYV